MCIFVVVNMATYSSYRLIAVLSLAAVLLAGCKKTGAPATYIDDGYPKGTVLMNEGIYSEILGEKMHYSIYLPPSFDKEKTYPIIYLLHGYGERCNCWFIHDQLHRVANKMIGDGDVPELVVVAPEGRRLFYIDNYYGNGKNYEQYFFEEFMPEIENLYSIKKERAARMIGGFSMGGYGSLRYGLVHGDTFCHVYAMSAFIGDAYGAPSLTPLVDEYLDAVHSGITVECGANDFFTTEDREFTALLTSKGIPNEYIERPGSHAWLFWSACTPKILLKAASLFGFPDSTTDPDATDVGE